MDGLLECLHLHVELFEARVEGSERIADGDDFSWLFFARERGKMAEQFDAIDRFKVEIDQEQVIGGGRVIQKERGGLRCADRGGGLEAF